MTLPVFLSDAVTGAVAGSPVVLDGDEGRHAATVKRIRAGEQVVLTDGAGTSATCKVIATSKSALELEVLVSFFAERAEPIITVVQALPKGDRGELAVEMLTEVGVDRIVPWAASRSIAAWKGERGARGLARWRATAREATKQSRRFWLPDVTELMATEGVVELVEAADLALVLHEEGQLSLTECSFDGIRSVVLVIGPEGGISDDEIGEFGAARSVRMGSTVMRTSTAGVAAAAAILSRTPRWSKNPRWV